MWCWPFVQKFLSLRSAMSSAEIVESFSIPSPLTVSGILGRCHSFSDVLGADYHRPSKM